MPLIRDRWFSSAEKGHRLFDADFFSLEILTTHDWVLATASTMAVRRTVFKLPDPAATGADPDVTTATLRHSANVPRNPCLRRNKGIGTAVVPTA
jgi:hypothetical protein